MRLSSERDLNTLCQMESLFFIIMKALQGERLFSTPISRVHISCLLELLQYQHLSMQTFRKPVSKLRSVYRVVHSRTDGGFAGRSDGASEQERLQTP